MSRPQRPDDAELKRLYVDEHLTLNQVGERYGYTGSWARKRLKAAGVQMRAAGPRPNAPEVEAAFEAEIARLYRDEQLSLQRVADRMGHGVPWVLTRLRRTGVKVRPVGGDPVPVEIETEARRLYVEEGMRIIDIAKQIGMSNSWTRDRLKRMGVELRPRGRQISNEEVVHSYVEKKMTMTAIASDLNISQKRVRQILEANDVEILTPTQRLTQIDCDELRRLYVDERRDTPEIAEILGVTTSGVNSALQRCSIQARRGTPLRLNAKQLQQHLDDQLSDDDIAALYHVTRWAVTKKIRELQLKRPYVPPEHAYPMPSEMALRLRYVLDRESLATIATHYGVPHSTVRRWLKRAKIPLRTATSPSAGNRRDQDIDRDQLEQMYTNQKWTAAEIGKHIGVSKRVVLGLLHEYAIAVRPSGPPRASNARPLLDRLYDDVEVVAVLKAHGIPIARKRGTLRERFAEPSELPVKLLEQLYVTCGLSNQMISLLTGHAEQSIRRQMQQNHIRPRPSKTRAPWSEDNRS